MKIVSKIRLKQEDTCGFFVRTEDDRVLLSGAYDTMLTAEDLRKLFSAAYKYWNIPSENSTAKEFSGTLIRLDGNEKIKFRQLSDEFDFRWCEKLDTDEPIYIIGGDIGNITDDEIQRLAPHWNRAKIFTLRGFDNYLHGNVSNNQSGKNDQILGRLLKLCHYMNGGYFKWPSTDCYPGRNVFDVNLSWIINENGVLSEMGYHVGRDGLPENKRREILDKVYNSAIPYPGDVKIDEWGKPQSMERLRKMANALAAFARNARQRANSSLDDAIEQWEDDLAYLKVTYYEGRYDRYYWLERYFNWPYTRTRR